MQREQSQKSKPKMQQILEANDLHFHKRIYISEGEWMQMVSRNTGLTKFSNKMADIKSAM